MSWIKKITQIFSYLIFLFVAVAVLLEVIFRILPTTSPVDLQAATGEEDILRFYPNQTAVFSLGGNFYKTVTKETNNAGFYSSFNFIENKKPDIMVIGDSYVEAVQIETSDTLGEIIAAKENKKDIYQMGVSGVPMSQYIKMVEYAQKNYKPDHFIIVIVGNDFDESLCEYRIKLGTWCFDENMKLTFNPFNGYTGLRSYARKSAFARYVFLQVGINWRDLMAVLKLKPQGMEAASEYAGNVKRLKSRDIFDKSVMVVDKFFEELEKLNISDAVTLVLDANRQDIYNNQRSESYFKKMRDYTIIKASENGVRLVDMRPIFLDDYKENQIKFEFPTDGHWNEHAHKLVAEALMDNN
ncbi:hypothetical protein OAO96_00890 [Amylibacter sp.]|nr:hypothetical protein [Amylibacter sp.]